MSDIIITIWFFIILIPSIYLVYTCLQCFDFERALRKGKIREFKILMFVFSVVIAFVFSQCFVTILERIINIIQK